MDTVDAKWIAARLSGERGEKARLARAMGIKPDVLSKIMSGTRQIQANEIPAVLAFFHEDRTEFEPLRGMAEDVAPYTVGPGSTASALAAEYLQGTPGTETYILSRPMVEFGLLEGDVLIVDRKRQAKVGDLCVVTFADPHTADATTELRRFLDPWLVSASARQIRRLSDSADVAILGIVSSCIRKCSRTA